MRANQHASAITHTVVPLGTPSQPARLGANLPDTFEHALRNKPREVIGDRTRSGSTLD